MYNSILLDSCRQSPCETRTDYEPNSEVDQSGCSTWMYKHVLFPLSKGTNMAKYYTQNVVAA
jgi:hypothetical protein